MFKMFVDTIPTFNGNSDTLPSFISSCDYLFSTFVTSDQTIQKYLIRVVQTKLVGRAQLLVGCRTELTNWSLIKSALKQCFGDNRSLECLEQDLFLASPFKNEQPLEFGKRLQVLRSCLSQKLTLSEPSPVIREAMLKQYEGVCLRAFIRGLSGPLQTIIRLKNPESLETALSYLVEEQNFQYTQNIFKHANQRPTHSNFQSPRPSFNQPFGNNVRYQAPVQQSQQRFPSEPMNIQSIPVQRNFPTNREVFGPPRNTNVFKPTGNAPSSPPQPMSVSTRNTFRPRAPQKQSYFRPSGPRNFSSEELFQMEQSNFGHNSVPQNFEQLETNEGLAKYSENQSAINMQDTDSHENFYQESLPNQEA
nr:unnamed protein product [Callosobruchus chinensis]CAH7735650.1 unnamed protein product [Callosobruchus chinensis]CAH7739554.1 unnamed protein product [Callosobruchus chinensis]